MRGGTKATYTHLLLPNAYTTPRTPEECAIVSSSLVFSRFHPSSLSPWPHLHNTVKARQGTCQPRSETAPAAEERRQRERGTATRRRGAPPQATLYHFQCVSFNRAPGGGQCQALLRTSNAGRPLICRDRSQRASRRRGWLVLMICKAPRLLAWAAANCEGPSICLCLVQLLIPRASLPFPSHHNQTGSHVCPAASRKLQGLWKGGRRVAPGLG